MQEMHRLLQSQLQENFGSSDSIPQEWQGFIETVNQTYWQFDVDRSRLEDSLEQRLQELLQANSAMQAVFHAIPDLVFRLDREGRILDYKVGHTADLSLPPAKLLGKRFQDLQPKELRGQFESAIAQVLTSQSMVRLEYSQPVDDQRHLYEARLLPLYRRAAGKSYNYQIILMVRQISDEQEAQAALSAVEAALREESDLIDAILGSPGALVMILDSEGRIVRFNRACEQTTGYGAEEVRGNYAWERLALPEERQEFQQVFTNLIATHGANQLENHWFTKEGERRLIAWSHTVQLDGNGGVKYAIATGFDITNYRHAQEQLRKEKNFFNTLIEASPAFIVAVGADGTTQMMNQAMLSALGYALDEVIGRNYLSIVIAPEEQAKFAGVYDRVLKRQRQRPFWLEIHIVTKDQQKLLVEWHCRPVFSGEQLEIFFGVGIDITERRKAEEALRESEERFRSLVSNIPGAIYRRAADTQATMEFISDAITDIAGYAAKEFIHNCDRTFASIIHPEDLPMVQQVSWAAAQAKRPYTLEYRIIHLDGTLKWVYEKGQGIVCEASPTPLVFLNEVEIAEENPAIATVFPCLDGAIFDITERKQTEETLQKSEAKNRAWVQAIPDLMFQIRKDDHAWVLLEVKDEFSPFSSEDKVGRRVQDVWPLSLAQLAILYLERAIATGQTQIFEYQLPVAGNLRDYEARLVVSGEDEVLALVRDITERKQTEQTLRLMQFCIDRASEAVLWMGPDARFLYANDAACQLLGYSRSELLSMLVFNIDPNFPVSTWLHHWRSLRQQGSFTIESTHRAKNGRIFPVEVTFNYVEFNGSEYNCSFVRDISGRKEAEAALVASERKFRTLAEAIAASTFIAQGHYFRYVNAATEAITGYSRQELLKMRFWDIIHREFRDLVRLRGLARLQGEPVPNRYEFKIITKSGEERWLDFTGSTIEFEGQPAILGTAFDITERKQVEEALRHSESQLIEQTKQLKGTLKKLKQTQAQLIQTEKMSSLGQLVAGVAHEINNPVNFIYANLTHAEQYTQELLQIIDLYQQHYPDPPTPIQEAAEAVDLDFMIEDLSKLLSSMKVGANRIRQIVLSLRNFSRLDEAEMKSVDLHEGLDSTLLILHNRLKSKADNSNIQIIKEYGKLPRVECYAGQMNQVFMNILNNAIDALEKYSPPQTITIRTELGGNHHHFPDDDSSMELTNSLENRDRSSGAIASVVIRIRDTGPGMTSDVKARVFDPFFTTKPVGKGTGLGLSISYQIVVERHGGILKCFSEPGQGTEFWIEIPITQHQRLTHGT